VLKKKAERSAELKKLYDIRRRERINKYQGLNVYVKYLEDHITEEKLRKEFEPFGHIENVKIMSNEKGQSKGFGFVCFSTQEEANRAIQEIGRNTVLPGCTKPIYVAIHQPRELRQQRFNRQGGRSNKGMSNIHQPGVYPPQQGPGPVYYAGGMYPPRMVPPGTHWAPQGQYPNMPGNYMPQQVPSTATRPGTKGGRNQPGNQPRANEVPRTGKKDEEQLHNPDRQKIGERIYEIIAEKENQELARRITGMLVYDPKWTYNALFNLVEDDSKLDEVISEAKAFLEQQAQIPVEHEDN
jgi:polyadenylate-binding protein